MQKLRVLIADDERPARAFLRSVLRSFDEVEIVGEAENGAEAVELINSLGPDLAFLDLQMPEMSGIEAVKRISDTRMPMVAFVTAYDQFAIQAFELNAIDYLLKPVEPERIKLTLDRASERVGRGEWHQAEAGRIKHAARTYDDFGRSEMLERIPVKKRDEIYLVPVSEIASIIADGELLRITTNENQRYEINFRLKDLEPRLDESRFLRLSRGALVNLDQISHISPLPGGTYSVSLHNGQEVISSRLQSKILRQKLLRL